MLPSDALSRIEPKRIQDCVETIKEIREAFLLPPKIVAQDLNSIHKALSDRSFWIALSDIHSITKGKLKDWDLTEKDKFKKHEI